MKGDKMKTKKWVTRAMPLLCVLIFTVGCADEAEEAQKYREYRATIRRWELARAKRLERERAAEEDRIEAEGDRIEEAISKTGTGFAVSKDGVIVTAYHVIQNAKVIKVHLTEDSFVFARVLRRGPMNDLAVLKIENATPNFLKVVPLRSVKSGDRVFTIGYPVSSILGREAKYTEGVVSSLSGIEGASSFLQITVPVQPGNSGGPLVNEKGEVVGIITSSAAILPFIKKSGTLPQNINWAVKADYLRPLIELPSVEQKKLSREQLITHVKKATFFIESE